jgi:hypothetical protein
MNANFEITNVKARDYGAAAIKLFQRRAQTQWAADQRRRDVLMTITAINPFASARLRY